MLRRVLLALLYGVITALAVYVVGLVVALLVPSIGSFIESIAGIIGLIAAIFFFLQGRGSWL